MGELTGSDFVGIIEAVSRLLSCRVLTALSNEAIIGIAPAGGNSSQSLLLEMKLPHLLLASAAADRAAVKVAGAKTVVGAVLVVGVVGVGGGVEGVIGMLLHGESSVLFGQLVESKRLLILVGVTGATGTEIIGGGCCVHSAFGYDDGGGVEDCDDGDVLP